ncbi:MAG: hypothetical protein ACE5IM_02355, partial [Nitrospinota bacterium]
RAVLWFYGVSAAAAAGLLIPAGLPVVLVLALAVVTVSSMGFAPSIRLGVQVSGPGLQGTAVGYILALGMVIGSVLPTLFGWLVETTGSFAVGFLVVLASPLAGFLAMWRLRTSLPRRKADT